MNDTFYFTHDYNSRTDKKIRRLISKFGMAGYGIYWAIVEDLYQNDNKMPLDYEMYAIEMRIDENVIKAIICDSELFKVKENYFSSDSVARRLKERKEKSEKTKKSAKARWNKVSDSMQTQCDRIADALQPEIESNAKKGKERKGKELNNTTTTTTTTTDAADALFVDEVDNTDLEIQEYFSSNVPPGADPVKEAEIFKKINDLKNWAAAGGRQNWRKVADLYIRKIKIKKNGNTNRKITFTDAYKDW